MSTLGKKTVEDIDVKGKTSGSLRLQRSHEGRHH